MISDPNLLRIDGRIPNQIRRMQPKVLFLDRTYIELNQGNTSVRASVIQGKERGVIDINMSFLNCSRNESLSDKKIYEMKTKISDIFLPMVLHDNQVDMVVEVHQDDGSLFTTIVNSLSLACCMSGIILKDMVLGITLNELLDLTAEEEKMPHQTKLVYSVNEKKILYLEANGKAHIKKMEEIFLNGYNGIEQIYYELRHFLSKTVEDNKCN